MFDLEPHLIWRTGQEALPHRVTSTESPENFDLSRGIYGLTVSQCVIRMSKNLLKCQYSVISLSRAASWR